MTSKLREVPVQSILVDGGLFAEHTDHWKPDEALPSVARLHFDVYALTIQSKAGNSLENKFSIEDSNHFLELSFITKIFQKYIERFKHKSSSKLKTNSELVQK